MQNWIPTLVILALVTLLPAQLVGALALAALGGIAGRALVRAIIRRLSSKPAAPVVRGAKVLPFRRVT